MRRRSSVCAVLLLASCAAAAQGASGVTTSLAPTPMTGTGVELQLDAPLASASSPPPATSPILVTPDRKLDVPSEVVGVLDFHSLANTEDKGFDELRARAAALGADAVIGAEFEHGEVGGLSHLSGMAVRRR